MCVFAGFSYLRREMKKLSRLIINQSASHLISSSSSKSSASQEPIFGGKWTLNKIIKFSDHAWGTGYNNMVGIHCTFL